MRASRAGRPSATAVVLAAAAALGLVTPAVPTIAQPLEVAQRPELPTIQQAVTAVLTVRGFCPQVGEPVFTSISGGLLIDLELEGDSCSTALPPPDPLVFEVPLGRLPPGVYRLRTSHPAVAQPVEHVFTVYAVSSLLIELPEDPITSDELVTFTVVGFDDCPQVLSSTFRGRVFTVEYTGECPAASPLRLFEVPFAGVSLDSGTYEIRVFDVGVPPVGALVKREVIVHEANGCAPGAEILCLQAGRFRVEVEWRDFTNLTGRGQAIPLADRDDTGLFWFFDEENVELTVKVLQACGVNGVWWVFVASGSTVGYEVTVTDTRTGESETYGNALGEVPELTADTDAFACP